MTKQNCEEIMQTEFGYTPTLSKVVLHNDNEWKSLTKQLKTPNTVEGIYFPKTHEAHLKENTEYLPLNFFHEYYGHASFIEHSTLGQELTQLEQYQKTIELQEHLKKNYATHEGYAIWIEHYLAKKNGLENLFYQKLKTKVNQYDQKCFQNFLTYSQQYGNLATTSQIGLPKYYNTTKINDLLQRLYGENYKTIQHAILYGSQKPHSDIDLFIVSDIIKSQQNHWLDIYSIHPDKLDYLITNLDISITDPITTGTTIIGNQKKLQTQIQNTPITTEAIQYNYNKSQEQTKNSQTHPPQTKQRKIGEKYAKSYHTNAEQLQQGKKILTLTNSLKH